MSSSKPEKKESLLLNLALNIAIPTLVLTKLGKAEYLGPTLVIVVALAFPIAYGVFDFYRQRKVNFFSALGVISVLLTGGISLLKLDPKYIAIKEASIPALFAIAVLVSTRTRFPLVKTFLFNDKIMQVERINAALSLRKTQVPFENSLLNASYIVAASFVLSSVLNYLLAKMLIVSLPGTEAYATELGKMTLYSYIVITIPSISVLIFGMVYLYKRIATLTELSFEQIFVGAEEEPNNN